MNNYIKISFVNEITAQVELYLTYIPKYRNVIIKYNYHKGVGCAYDTAKKRVVIYVEDSNLPLHITFQTSSLTLIRELVKLIKRINRGGKNDKK